MLSVDDTPLWNRRFWWLLVGVALFRVIYVLTCIDFQIGGEEPYQWDWGRRLDWCYYSKPPMIGWLMAALRTVFGYEWWALRLASITLGSCTLFLMFALGRRMFDAHTGFFAALMFVCTPANMAGNFLFSIDSPLAVCWMASLFFFWCAVEAPHRWSIWSALTLAIGLGTLTKQMMLVFPGLMVAFVALVPGQRALLKRPAFWLTLAGGLLFLSPLLWWNTQHDGVTFNHMKEHFRHGEEGLSGVVEQVLRFPILQSVMYSPITWVVLMGGLWWCWRHWRTAGDREHFLFLFSAPALLVFQAMAFRQYINENWPAVYYLSAFVLGAGHALSKASVEVWMRRGIKLGACMVAFVYLALPLVPVMGLTGHKKLDPALPMRGWEVSGEKIGELLAQVPRPEQTFVLVLDHRNYASQMAFHLPQHPIVYRWTRDGRVESQYEVWPNASDKVGWDAFVIYPDSENDDFKKKNLATPIRRAFRSTEKLADVEVPIGQHSKRSFQVFLCKDMKHWPKTGAEEGIQYNSASDAKP